MSEKIKLTIYTTTACEYTKDQVRKKLELEKLEYQCELGLFKTRWQYCDKSSENYISTYLQNLIAEKQSQVGPSIFTEKGFNINLTCTVITWWPKGIY